MDTKRDQKISFKISQISHKLDHMTPRFTQTNVIDAAIIQDLEQKKRKLTSKRNKKIKRPWIYKVNSYFSIIKIYHRNTRPYWLINSQWKCQLVL